MSRYFIEVSYKGTRYAGFQIQHNAHTVQAELEAALKTYFREDITLTGSSRTDSGVHARQNYFHFDSELSIDNVSVYNINAILPSDVAVHRIIPVRSDDHCRFHAVARSYEYTLYRFKDPFLEDLAYFYPYTLDHDLLQRAADIVLQTTNFRTFSKRNTQVKTFDCHIKIASWIKRENLLVFNIKGNRFLRGMVRGLVGTMLLVGRGKISIAEFVEIINSNNCSHADFSVPGKGLCLMQVEYPEHYFERSDGMSIVDNTR
jgi:tRNA pseudouridine38-40 synthase